MKMIHPDFLKPGLLASLLSMALNSAADIHYVDVNNSTPGSPYTNWASAASDIQTAIDAAEAGDEVVVKDGLYQVGAREIYGTNRVAVTRPITLRSLNGPEVTFIRGDQWVVRCVYLTNGAVLAGFTLTNGAAEAGGGVDSFACLWRNGFQGACVCSRKNCIGIG